ncbi:hypothetical protein [[Phormidium] sp. ETS-05]|uniref:hypothetical protein n=1 Tax=[Phormidium] sp. ETS-05 TaxID=222819 RepID=UPI0018EEED58|nr:hypothetical protein [[Phormidium] sp. ETS-05]
MVLAVAVYGVINLRKNPGLLNLLSLSLLVGAVLLPLKSPAQRRPPVEPPLDLSLLEPGAEPEAQNVLTMTSISQVGLTVPSLWWEREQFGGKLLDNWLAYPGDENQLGRVDLVVNRQIWSLLDYLQRYEFVQHFGFVARDYGYNTRVFNRQGILLGAYTCEFTNAEETGVPSRFLLSNQDVATKPSFCVVWVDAAGFQGVRDRFGQ